MESEIKEIRTKAEQIRDYGLFVHDELVVVSSPHYDPLHDPIPGITGYETHEDVKDIDNVLHSSKKITILGIIDNNLQMLQTATILIEAQMALRQVMNGQNIEALDNCIASDKDLFEQLMHEAVDLAAANQEQEDGVEPMEFAKALGHIADDFASLSAGHVPAKFASMDAPSLQNKIFDLRSDFADLALDKVQCHYALAHVDMDYIKHMKRFMDDAVIPEDPDIQEEIRECFKRSAEVLPVCEYALNNIDELTAILADTENDAVQKKAAKVYRPLSMLTLNCV